MLGSGLWVRQFCGGWGRLCLWGLFAWARRKAVSISGDLAAVCVCMACSCVSALLISLPLLGRSTYKGVSMWVQERECASWAGCALPSMPNGCIHKLGEVIRTESLTGVGPVLCPTTDTLHSLVHYSCVLPNIVERVAALQWFAVLKGGALYF